MGSYWEIVLIVWRACNVTFNHAELYIAYNMTCWCHIISIY